MQCWLCVWQEEELVEVSAIPADLHKVPVAELLDYVAKRMISWSAVVVEQLRGLACPDDLLTLFGQLDGLLAAGGLAGTLRERQCAEPGSALGH